MLTTALFTIAKKWKQPKWPIIDELKIWQLWERRTSCICNNIDGPWACYAKWDVRQRKTRTVSYHLHVESKKIQTPKNRVKWWLPGDEEWGIGRMLFKGTNLRGIVNNPRNLKHSIVNIDNNIALQSTNLLRD